MAPNRQPDRPPVPLSPPAVLPILRPSPPERRVEGRFLKGPRSRGVELWTLLRMAWEIFQGMRSYHFIGPAVTVFGSARFREDHPYYQLARQVGAKLARAGFAVMTGGGPGIMEAANRGARESGGFSVGANIELPEEQSANAYLDRYMTFDFFFARKLVLVKYSYAFVVLPGGFGTLDEVFETATLIQTGKIRNFPLVMMGTEYWQPILQFMRDRMVPLETIAQADIDLIVLTDDPDEAVRVILDAATSRFGWHWEALPRPQWILREHARRNRRPAAGGTAPASTER